MAKGRLDVCASIRSLFIGITLLAGFHAFAEGQRVTNDAPPQDERAAEKSGADYPDAVVLPHPAKGEPVGIESDRQSERNKVFVLDGDVVITYGDRVVRADHVEYDGSTGEVTATGHLQMTGGANRERIEASHGSYNLKTETGRFFDAKGSIGLGGAKWGTVRRVYSNEQPFLFTGRLVEKTGADQYDIYDGSVTSCLLPKPDWMFTAEHFSVSDGMVRGRNSTFRLLNVPVLYLPYVTHPEDPGTRESGFMIPSPGYSGVKGFTLQEQFYLVLNRSMDLTIGASYYSEIGFGQDATFRYKGAGLDFIRFRYTGVLDRRTTINQGGEDAVLSMRRDFTPSTRFAADVEYLSSYVYREVFTENFNQAVTSDIVSTAYLAHEAHGVELAGLVDRYQGIKLIAQGQDPQEQVRIFHVPTLSLDTTEHRLAGTPFEVSLNASVSGLKRTQPNFATGGVVERVDVHPAAAAPFSLGGWSFRPEAGLEETAYTRSFLPGMGAQPAQESLAALSRSDVEMSFAVRPPVIERVFALDRGASLLGTELKHTIEPEVTYRLTKGINDFSHVLRFDPIDVVADTNELEYGVVQRLFRKAPRNRGCEPAATEVRNVSGTAIPLPGVDGRSVEEVGGLNADPNFAAGDAVGGYSTGDSCGSDEMISWRLTQAYFFNPSFGNAVVRGRRNIFDSTLQLSGVAFLTEPRNISPLVSRLRVRTSAHTDVEWDFDLDTGAKKFTSSNLFVDVHAGNGWFGALSYASLDAPGRFYTEEQNPPPTPTPSNPAGVTSQISDFNQVRVLLGFGSPVKTGLSLAGNTGLDLKNLYGETSTITAGGVVTTKTVYPALLQYATVQANYNWNCCGLSVEYRKFELGSVRNEGSYKFNFTLANIATVGNLRRAERLF